MTALFDRAEKALHPAVFLVLLGLAFAGAPRAALSQTAVDLELVLAVDASASVDAGEYALQMRGIAAAFRSAEVQAAIAGGPLGRIAVALAVWAEAERPADLSPFVLIEAPMSAERFAQMAERWPRRVNGGTGIGSGLAHAMRHFDRNGFAGARQVVDVSGDGRETPPRDYTVLIDTARGMALSRGVTINGLAIETDDPELAAWYRAHVASGPQSFVLAIDDYGDFAEAMRRKLLREIEALPPVSRLDAARGR
ncbi:DUF1194 domain-containing protein [Stappia sp.]|uniref:DUF1194 domain-containing protein n=1 Tax=Stappia sp. TaxID=1870903 RepID=UPI0032D8BC8B